MLNDEVYQAVLQGQFHIYTATQLSEAAERLMGHPFGGDASSPGAMPALAHPHDEHGPACLYPPDSILGRAERTLQAFRLACMRAGLPRRAG
jgi:hypothetical protein